MTAAPDAPVADVRPTVRRFHGDEFVDDYEWLRDVEDPDVLALLEAENAHTDARTAHLADLRETIFGEIKARTRETDLSVPVRHGDWWYFSRTVEGLSYAIRSRCPATPGNWEPPAIEAGVDAPGEQVLLDSNLLAEGHEFFSLGAFSLTDDDTLLAYSTDTTGDERYTIRFRDLRTGE